MLCKQMRKIALCCGELRGTEKTGFFFFFPKAKLRVKFVVVWVLVFILFFNLYSSMAALGLRCCTGLLWLWQGGAALCRGARPLTAATSLIGEHRLRAHRLQQLWCTGFACSAVCGVFPDQESNSCPLLWQADSYPLYHQGSPGSLFLD